MKVETLMQVIRNQYEGDTRSTLDCADLDQLLPALNMAMWMAKGRPQQQRAATLAAPAEASSHITSDQPTAVLSDEPDLAREVSPPTPLQQIEQPQCTDHEASSSSTAAVMPAPSASFDSLTSSVMSSNHTGNKDTSAPSYLPKDEVENAPPSAAPSITTSSSHDVSALHTQPQALSATTSSTMPPRKKAKAKGLARAKSRPMLVVNPHHADIGIFAGKTVDEILIPHNGISTEEFFGARALYISAHFSGHKEALEKINQKRMAEGLPEMRFKDRTWNHRLENALMHKFGRANYDSSLEELGDARKDDQARAAYVALLMSDLARERKPTSVCMEESCIGKWAREQKKSLSTLNASNPATGSYGTLYTTGLASASTFDESSSEAPASEAFKANTGATAPRSLKRASDVKNDEPASEQPGGVTSKRRKSRKTLSGHGPAQPFDNPALDPALFCISQAQSGVPHSQHHLHGNDGVVQNRGPSNTAAEAYNYPPSFFTAPGSRAATTNFDEQISDHMRTGNVNGAIVSQEGEDEHGFGDVGQSFEEITAHVGSGIDTHRDGPGPTLCNEYHD
ncbi:hypothetical protein CKM354_000024500 [Cercospora kikuchii]|uniref:Uncharacterized protein n=1 Tax=Cercospora kikuchii TaxID=84275 RepID=A0A9P3CDJ7_9PEZI|nr:uncharacterized protein CKM354_000024500 [Cercospora kikuchii]GIZ36778.1 hypothetical protein CKM354_000024500 [Cercospora kikuchii]